MAAVAPQVFAADDLAIDHIMYKDPVCDVPPIRLDFSTALAPLWSQAMQRPESELRRLAADTVAIAHQRGMTGMQGMAEQLAGVLGAADQPSSVRRAAIHALVILDAKDHAELLAKSAAKEGLETSLIVEPALAKWKYQALRDTWLRRLEDRESPPLWRLLAMRCLGAIGEQSAKAPLLAHVHDKQVAVNLRLAAAQSLGQICTDGLLADARQLMIDKSQEGSLERILGATLLVRHSGEETINVLRELANDSNPAVAALAWNRLLELDPARTFDLAPAAIANSDVNVRRAGARSFVAKGDVAAIQAVAPLMDDPNPALRRYVARSLFDLAGKAELRAAVIAESEKMLATDKWRGLEQATLIAVYLDHKSAANREVELLKHKRAEVGVTAAWALRRFKLPENLPAMLQHAADQQQRITKGKLLPHELSMVGGQHTQLFQAFGEMRYKESNALMRKFVPKSTAYSPESRAAACWALGYVYEGAAPEDLTNQFMERLSDVMSPMPEMGIVRRMCATSLGRMKSQAGIPTLRRFAEIDGLSVDVGHACWWSLEQLTGAKRPPLPDLKQSILGWFLEPAR